jgi:hypothetical protein
VRTRSFNESELASLPGAVASGDAAAATGQVPGRVYRAGVLVISNVSVDFIRQYTLPELAKAGFVEGRNLVLEVRYLTNNAVQNPGDLLQRRRLE